MEETEYILSLYEKVRQKPYCPAVKYEEVMLPMKDGTRLRTMIWMPRAAEAVSVIVTRSCYPQQEAVFSIHGQELARRGFGFVLQWCRGTGGSGGEWIPNVQERGDGLDTMAWLVSREDVRNIGYWGDSYLASAGWCMADAVPEKVKSMYLGVYGTDRYESVYQDGLFRQDIFTAWAMENAGVKIEAGYLQSLGYLPQLEVDESLWKVKLDWYRDWIGNTDRDSAYWSKEGFWKMMREIPANVRIPVFIREGWYDHHLGSALKTWEALAHESKEHSILQIGPWRHGYDVVLEGHATDRLEDDRVQSVLDWFEETLQKEKLLEQRISKYVIGGDEWLERDGVTGKKEMIRLYFDGGRQGKARSLKKEPGEMAQVRYLYDPQNPVFSHGSESCFHSRERIGSLLQPPCGYRPDVKSFLSEKTEESLLIDGAVRIKLWVSSTAPDTAYTVKVMEVFEDGRTVNIRGGITTLAYRNQAVRRRKYKENSVVQVKMVLWPIVWKLRAGSKVRVDISSSDFPQYAVHTNYAGVWSEQRDSQTAEQTIYMGNGYESVIELPVCEEPFYIRQAYHESLII